MTTLHLRNSISRSPWRGGFLLIPMMLTCFALLPSAQAFTTDPDDTFTNFNTAAGFQASLANTGLGGSNTAFGNKALRATTTGSSNAAFGGFALINNIDGVSNTAIGNNAMFSNQHGDNNMALGQGALGSNVSGNSNVAMGSQALAANTSSNNTGVGFQALSSNTSGTNNVANGYQALLNNQNGDYNTAMGFQALLANTAGGENVAIGPGALFGNIDGVRNTAVGANFVLFNNDHGSFNTAMGDFALPNNVGATANWNTAFGYGALFNNTTGSLNTAIGVNAGQGSNTGSGIVCIGWNQFSDNVNNRTFIKNIGSTSQPSGGVIDFVTVNTTNNKMGHNSSSRRYKEDIKSMDKSSELIYRLKPVTFRLKKSAEWPNPILDYGLIAEDVAEVDPELAIRNGEGQIESVRYLAIQSMLLNEFLKEHQKVQKLEATLAAVEKRLKEQDAKIDKVNAKVELTKAAPQVANNGQ